MKIKSGKFSIKLQVTFQRATQHYRTIFDLSKEDYNKLPAPRINSYLQNVRKKLNTIQRVAEDCINQMDSFSFYEFEKKFVTNNELFKPRKKLKEPSLLLVEDAFDYSYYKKRFPIFCEDHSRPGSISIVYLASIKTLLQEERIGTALSYQHSYNSLKKFKGNALFTEITVSYLYQYEKWMTKRGRSRTTVGIKLRPLRTIFNEAIGLGMIKREYCYPFGRRKYQIPTGRNIKKALELNDISSIYYHQPECSNEKKAKDYWLFCYFGNGMNPKDMVYLKNKDIQDGYLVFVRAKTERATRNDPKPIIVYISEDMWEIIQRYRNKDTSPDAYIFPIMDAKLNPLKQYELVASFTKFINDGMFREHVQDLVEIL
jgi:hypothetical protein